MGAGRQRWWRDYKTECAEHDRLRTLDRSLRQTRGEVIEMRVRDFVYIYPTHYGLFSVD